MDERPETPRAWKQKIAREMREYALNVVHLSLFFGMFYWYRRIILAQQNIVYANYGIAVIQAMVLGKIIMVGGFIHLGRGLEDKPLIYPTLLKSLSRVLGKGKIQAMFFRKRTATEYILSREFSKP